jgi:hypothetical protein
MLAHYSHTKKWINKKGETRTYYSTIARTLKGTRLTKAQIEEIEPCILAEIYGAPDGASMKDIHRAVNMKIPYRCSIELVRKYMSQRFTEPSPFQKKLFQRIREGKEVIPQPDPDSITDAEIRFLRRAEREAEEYEEPPSEFLVDLRRRIRESKNPPPE